MSKSVATVALVALLLVESVKYEGKALPAGKVFEFDPETAKRLLAKGAAVVPPAPPQMTETTKVVEKVVEREVEKEVEVAALSGAGHAFLKAKSAKLAAEFVASQTDVAVVAELQALEYRRSGGARPEVVEAIGRFWAAQAPAGS